MAFPVLPAVPQELVVPLGVALAAVLLIVIAWLATRRPEAVQLFRVDAAGGALRLFPGGDLDVTLRAFRLAAGKRAVGFDLLVKNRGDEIDELAVSLDGSRAALGGIPPGRLVIRPWQLGRGGKKAGKAAKIGRMAFAFECVPERDGLVPEIEVPMNEVLSELQRAGKIALIEEAGGGRAVVDAAREREVIARQFEEMLSARRPPAGAAVAPVAAETAEVLQERLKELAEEEKQAQLSYLRREVTDAAFGDIVNKIQSKRIEARAKLARLKGPQ